MQRGGEDSAGLVVGQGQTWEAGLQHICRLPAAACTSAGLPAESIQAVAGSTGSGLATAGASGLAGAAGSGAAAGAAALPGAAAKAAESVGEGAGSGLTVTSSCNNKAINVRLDQRPRQPLYSAPLRAFSPYHDRAPQTCERTRAFAPTSRSPSSRAPRAEVRMIAVPRGLTLPAG